MISFKLNSQFSNHPQDPNFKDIVVNKNIKNLYTVIKVFSKFGIDLLDSF